MRLLDGDPPIRGSGVRQARTTGRGPAVDELVDAGCGELDQQIAGAAVAAGEERAVDTEAR